MFCFRTKQDDDDYLYGDLVDYGEDEEDEKGGRDLAGEKLVELVDDEYEFYEYNYVDGYIRVPQNYSGLQVQKFTQDSR